MPAQPSQILWSSYTQFEGPFYIGQLPYAAPSVRDFLDKALEVVTATEGGHYDAVNMYDRCILSVGLSQQCLEIHQLEPLIGYCLQADPAGMAAKLASLPVPVELKKNDKGQWRFFFLDGRGELDNDQKMRDAFLFGASGLKGQWTQEQTDKAKEVAAGIASIWDNPDTRVAQNAYVKARIPSYLMPVAKNTIYSDPSEDGYQGALKAAVMSYSTNNPRNADNVLARVAANPAWQSASSADKFELAMKSMALESGFAIWPMRYRAIAPVLSKLFGVTIPSLDDLADGHRNQPVPPTDDGLGTVKGIQQFLISKGYDLGPRGADGITGPKTRAAVASFQKDHGLSPTGNVDDVTHAEMLKFKT